MRLLHSAEVEPNNRGTGLEQKPNLVFILADDLGYGDLGCYGQKQIATPNIDRLAREGIRFTQFYAGSTVCAPSRCVLMTGLHTGHCYIRGNADQSLRSADHSVAQLLQSAGYTNGLFGKWGLGQEGTEGVPTRKGFDEFFGYLDQHHAHNYYPAFLISNESRIALKNAVPGKGPFGSGVATTKVEYQRRSNSRPSTGLHRPQQGTAVLLVLRINASARQQRSQAERDGNSRLRGLPRQELAALRKGSSGHDQPTRLRRWATVGEAQERRPRRTDRCLFCFG